MAAPDRWLAISVIAGVLFGVGVLADVTSLVRGPDEWRWVLAPMRDASGVALYATGLLAYLIFWLWSRDRAARATGFASAAWIGALCAAALLVQVSQLALFRSSPGDILFERLLSNNVSGYFTVAQELGHWPSALRIYDELMPGFRPDPHPRSKPPGIVLGHIGLEAVFESIPGLAAYFGRDARGIRCAQRWAVSRSDAALASNWAMGWLIVLLAAASMLPAFFMLRARAGPEAGWLAAGLLGVLPGRIVFASQMDTVYPLLGLLALWGVDAGVRRDRPVLVLLAGVALSVATFLSLVNALLAILVGLYLLFLLWERDGLSIERLTSREYVVPSALLVLGTLSIWIAYGLWAGITPWAIYEAAAPARHDLHRSYWVWLPGNLYEVAIFSGLAVMLLALRWPGASPARRPLYLAFWPLFGLLLLSGALRGEVGRIWLFLAPFPVLLVASETRTRMHGAVLIGVVALASFAMGLRWDVLQPEWPATTPRATLATAAPTRALDSAFGDDITLEGYDLALGERSADFTLYWRVARRPTSAYEVSIEILDEEGTRVAHLRRMPSGGRIPTTCWRGGEVVTDAHKLFLALSASPARRVRVGLIDPASSSVIGRTEFAIPPS